MDINVRAFRTVQAALNQEVAPDKRKESSRKGGLLGGRSRAMVVPKERRREIARKASLARWAKQHGAEKKDFHS